MAIDNYSDFGGDEEEGGADLVSDFDPSDDGGVPDLFLDEEDSDFELLLFEVLLLVEDPVFL